MPRSTTAPPTGLLNASLIAAVLALLTPPVALAESGGAHHGRGAHARHHAGDDAHHARRRHHQLRGHRLHRLHQRLKHTRHGTSHGLHLRLGDRHGLSLGLHSRHHRPSHHSLRHRLHRRFGHGVHHRRHRIGRHHSGHRRRHLDHDEQDTGVTIIHGSDPHDGQRHRERVAKQTRTSGSHTGHAWAQLAQGDARAALRSFANLAPESPRKAGPKVGYALALAELGRHDKAAWAMRRALRIDSEGVGYLAVPQPVHEHLGDLAETYHHHAERSSSADALFMAATLHYLRDEPKQAHALLAHVDRRDEPVSTTNLRKLVGEKDY